MPTGSWAAPPSDSGVALPVAYGLPFSAFLAWLFITTIRERRQSAEEGSESPEGQGAFAILERRSRA